MGKVIEVNYAFADLLDDKIRVVAEEHIISVSEDPSDLTASFSKANLEALLAMDGCNGFRLYPAVNNNELIMIAWGTKDGDDLAGADFFCLASNADGAVPVNGVPTNEDGIPRIPTNLAAFLLEGGGSGVAVVDELNAIRNASKSEQGLKVLFDNNYLNDEKEAFDAITFELIDVKLTDTTDLKRTIVGYAKRAEDHTFKGMSFLPCPPNCDHTYGQKQVILEVPPSAT